MCCDQRIDIGERLRRRSHGETLPTLARSDSSGDERTVDKDEHDGM